MRKIQRAAKAALQSPQSFSSATQVPLGGLGGLSLFFLNTETQRLRVFLRVRKIQRAAKAAFTENTELSAAMQVPLGGLGGLPLPQGFVATFKSLVIFVSRKNFVPLCLSVKFLTLN